ncbi:hypothetical protein PHLGIDRAFT_371864 [Phlebiopsis gigantea 11061_1 CR5-6]|uniref:DUF2415 domain-containing protein n=1 Tax=Phlebiopsis gigantea (strain 11061_1 CR5-6) TaxID=745531 RepID=A0A0C3S746_PHLG1|nr:hypothetical protein PHLGIDRAFT_371864 [Phlebiopsis gigantea 11061_1 CR5-6]
MSMESTQPAWSPPVYDVSTEPVLAHRGQLAASRLSNNFARWARWCPDGSAALAQCEDATLQYLDIPSDTLGTPLASDAIRKACLPQSAPVLDFAWYPFATTRDPASFCLVASVRESPVKLLDAADGRLRASYKIVDHRERHIAPHSLVFNMTGAKLYCGFEDAIEVFDLHAPGEGTRLHTTPTKKSRDGLKGIISALAFSPDAASGAYAAGSLRVSAPSSSNIAIFSESTGEVPVMFVGDERVGGYGVRASVSQLQFNPYRPYLLYASFRRHSTIYSWDIRGDTTKTVQTFAREFESNGTNQRLRFDVDITGSWLGAGDHHGGTSVFDLSSPENQDASTEVKAPNESKLHFKAHDDAVGSVHFHPLHPLLLSVSGSRHYTGGGDSDGSSSDLESANEEFNEDEDDISAPRRVAVRRTRERPSPTVKDASFKLWSFDRSSRLASETDSAHA